MSKFTLGVDLVWTIAAAEAAAMGQELIEPAHLLIALFKLEDLNSRERLRELRVRESDVGLLIKEIMYLVGVFSRFGLDPAELRRDLRKKTSRQEKTAKPRTEGTIHRSNPSRAAFKRAEELRRETGTPDVSLPHLFAALLDDLNAPIAVWLREHDVDVSALRDGALGRRPRGAEVETVLSPVQGSEDSPVGGGNELPRFEGELLRRFGKDLTELARNNKIHEAIGRRDEMLQIVRTLSRATKNNPLLLGDPGVGKTAVVEGLAWRIAQGNVPDTVRGKSVVQINIADLVAGTKYRGEFEKRLQKLVGEVASAPNVIIFIDEIHTMVGAGGGSDAALDAANILKPALARGELRCIGATTVAEYRKYIEKDPALERRFQPIMVEEPTPAETIEILQGLRPRLEQQHRVTLAEEALEASVKLATRYLPDRRLPDKAIDLLDEACARARITRLTVLPGESGQDNGSPTVAANAIAEVLADWAHVPLAQLTEDERARLLRMAVALRERVIGQDEAIDAVAQAVQRARAGLKAGGRPIGVLLFLGPTGTGKTELAKATASFLFGSDRAMTRLDMSEFHDRHTVSRLVGSPPGYVGSEDEGQLTGALRRMPFCVVLLDEIEKAHSDVLNLFLQVFEDGRLTSAKGRTVDASNALFIMTSNVGAHQPRARPIGFQPQKASEAGSSVPPELGTMFRPEFLNRIDQMVVFKALGMPQIERIAHLRLDALRDRLAEQGVGLRVTEAAVALLARVGYDEQFNARPLRRAIEQRLENPIGEMLLRGEVRSGQIVTVDAQVNELLVRTIGAGST